jgi:hypothetical protein
VNRTQYPQSYHHTVCGKREPVHHEMILSLGTFALGMKRCVYDVVVFPDVHCFGSI